MWALRLRGSLQLVALGTRPCLSLSDASLALHSYTVQEVHKILPFARVLQWWSMRKILGSINK